MLSSRCCWGSLAVMCAPAVDRPLPLVADFGVDQSEFYFWPHSVGHDQQPGQPQPAQAVNSIGIRKWLRCSVCYLSIQLHEGLLFTNEPHIESTSLSKTAQDYVSRTLSETGHSLKNVCE